MAETRIVRNRGESLSWLVLSQQLPLSSGDYGYYTSKCSYEIGSV